MSLSYRTGCKQRRILVDLYLRRAHAMQHQARDAVSLQKRCRECEQEKACAHSIRHYCQRSLGRSTVSLFETRFVLKLTWKKVASICADTVGVMARRCPTTKYAKIQEAEYPIADSKECAVRAEAAVPTSRRQRRMRQSFTRVRRGLFVVYISITQ